MKETRQSIKFIYAIIFSIILGGCSSLNNLSDSELSILNTTWEYSDYEKSYQITFIKNGKLKTTHPNETTPDNDTWKQSKNKIYFEFNDGYVKYNGKIKTIDLIVGKAENKHNSWTWKMKRVKTSL